MALEYCPGGDLYSLIHSQRKMGKRGLSTELIRFYGACVLQGLDHLHEHHVIYKDLKSENIVISKDGVAKITDFGVSIHQY